uniref:Uncharacterized protein n=1 Tax=Astyanax mexicanus TaxID=7994 RepID=A0A8B9HIE3_ASTMX
RNNALAVPNNGCLLSCNPNTKDTIPWPAASPDLSLIENMRDSIKRVNTPPPPQNLQELCENIGMSGMLHYKCVTHALHTTSDINMDTAIVMCV